MELNKVILCQNTFTFSFLEHNFRTYLQKILSLGHTVEKTFFIFNDAKYAWGLAFNLHETYKIKIYDEKTIIVKLNLE